MEYSYINADLDKKMLLNTTTTKLHPLLAENNLNQFVKMKDFFASSDFLLLVNGFLGTGKSAIVDHFLNFLTPQTIALKYNCYETTVLDDMLLAFFERLKELVAEGVIQEPKMRSDNFIQKINSYFLTVSAPIVLIIDSFDEVLKHNKPEILEFLKHLSQMGKVKVVLIARAFDNVDFDGVFASQRIIISGLEKHLFEKFLKSSNIKLIGPVSDELYKHTRGYFLYVALSVKIIQIRSLSLYEFLDGYGKSFLSYNDFILREGLALIDPVSGHLFRFLTAIRHPVSVKLLQTLRLFDEMKVKLFIETHILSRDGNLIYLKDYYKRITENSIPDNVLVKLHKSCVDLYNTQLPLKPMERDLLISRATMRSEIEYHSMFIPKKPIVKPQEILEQAQIQEQENVMVPVQDIEPETKDIKSISFIFESEEEENNIMGQIVDSINEFVTFSDEQLKEIERENNMSLLDLMNLARQEENNFNFRRVVMIYQRALMMKNVPDFQTFHPIIHTRLATAYAKLSDWFNALKYYEEAVRIYSAAGDIFKLAETKLEIAHIHYLMFKREQSRAVLEEVLAFKNLPAEYYVRAFIMSADLVDEDVQMAYKFLKLGLDFAEDMENEQVLAELYYKFAICSDDVGETKQAVLFYKNCVEIDKKYNPFISSAYSNLAVIYEDSGAKDAAQKFYELGLAIDEENGNFNGIYLSSMKLANLTKRANPAVALESYERAYKAACRLNETFYKVSSMMAIGDFYLFSKESQKALDRYIQAKSFAEGHLSESNVRKIERRITDLKLQLGLPVNTETEVQNDVK